MRRAAVRLALVVVAMVGLAFLAASGRAAEAMQTAAPVHFVGIDHFNSFARTTRGGTLVLTSPWFPMPVRWNELVVSWNAACPPGSHLQIETRADRPNATTPFYTLGLWSPDPARHPRESVPGQKDGLAQVKTDTLVCRERMARVQVRLTLGSEHELPRVKFLGLCVADKSVPPRALSPNHAAWGRTLEVPQRSQLGYPGALGWCSPTCVSMVLAHWAGVLHRPELDVPVPGVAQAVMDRNWPGTGNWPFNTAFAGSFAGLRAYVTRFEDLREIEDWLAAGVPVVTSGSLDLLLGKAADEGNGHLLVAAGFTRTGDVVVNDPWPNPKKENSLRKIFPRATFLRAWAHSQRTVYLIYPQTLKPPPDRFGHWTE